jgi:hypothetical protein
VATQLAILLEKKKHTMNSDPMDTSCIDLDNIIDCGLDDLCQNDRLELERELEQVKAKKLKRYFKTRDGVVTKVTTPSSSRAFRTQVTK